MGKSLKQKSRKCSEKMDVVDSSKEYHISLDEDRWQTFCNKSVLVCKAGKPQGLETSKEWAYRLRIRFFDQS